MRKPSPATADSLGPRGANNKITTSVTSIINISTSGAVKHAGRSPDDPDCHTSRDSVTRSQRDILECQEGRGVYSTKLIFTS